MQSRPPSHPQPRQPKPADRAFRLFQEGDADSLALVFDATAAELLRVACHLCHDLHTAEDLVQATFLVAIESKDQYDMGKASVFAWLVGILTNRARKLHGVPVRLPRLQGLSEGSERLVEGFLNPPPAD